MKLETVLKGLEILDTNLDLCQEISSVSYDSRETKPGGLFVAITGFAADGHGFIPMALEKGAAAVLCERVPVSGTPYVQVADTRAALAVIGANWFGHPADSMTVVGVTGTNGKTSTTVMLKSVLEQVCGAKVGLIGTIENQIGDVPVHTERTTPESFELQQLFAQMRDAGCSHVVMEVSSHALALHRVDGIRFSVGVFSNLTEDHLDFHKTMEAYAQAKAQLFSRCEKAVINQDDAYAGLMCSRAAGPVLTTAVHDNAQLRAEHVQLFADRVEFDVTWQGERSHIYLGIPGGFAVYNCLAVIGAALQLGLPLPEIARALRQVQGVKGRIEVVPTPGTDYTVIIDYSHTPDALENILQAVRGFCKGRIIAVFGCGGDRDPIKRPIMGRIGITQSDLAVITSDNPRTEDPMAIIDDILKGAEGLEKPYVVIENRRQAIRWAMDHAQKDDIIILAGKGHETYQIIGTEKTHLDEREEVALYLEENKRGGAGK